jgi:hypothetical protein
MKKEILRAFLVPTVTFLVAFGFFRLVRAQDKPPQLSPDSRIAILKAQLKQKQLESQFLQLQTQMTNLQTQYTETGKTLQDAIEAAYKEAKIEKKDWSFNADTLEFTKVPAASKAEAKKP